MRRGLSAIAILLLLTTGGCSDPDQDSASEESGDFGPSIGEIADQATDLCSDDPATVALLFGSKSEDPSDIAHEYASNYGSSFSAKYQAAHNACLVALLDQPAKQPPDTSEPACDKTYRLGLSDETNREILQELQEANEVSSSASEQVRQAIADAIDVFSGGPGDVTKALLDVIDACGEAELTEDW